MVQLSQRQGIDPRALGVGVVLVLLAVIVWRDAAALTVVAMYGMGPAAMPDVVAGALALLGVGHLVVAFRNGLPSAGPVDRAAVGWIAIGLTGLLLCVGLGGGVVPATTILFAATARGFGRRALPVDLAIGFVLGIASHLLFSRLLSLSLPAGPIERLL